MSLWLVIFLCLFMASRLVYHKLYPVERINCFKLKEVDVKNSVATLLVTCIMVASQNTDPHYGVYLLPVLRGRELLFYLC
jgi:hypothetical protein